MSESRIPSWLRLVISVVILSSAIGCAAFLVWNKEGPKNAEQDPDEITISAQKVKRYTGDIGIEVSGLVVPYREITIASEVTGRVITKTDACRPGRFVKAGEILVVVDQKDYQLEVNRITASLEQAKSSVLELEKEIEGARKLAKISEEEYNLQQQDYLRKKNSGAGFSVSELDQIRRQVLAAQSAAANQKSRLDVLIQSQSRLKNSLALSQVQLEQANIKLKRCVIRAPVDGVVVTEDVEENGFVQQGATVIRFEDTSKAEIRCNLRPKQLQWLKKNTNSMKVSKRDVYSAYQIPKVKTVVRIKGDQDESTWVGVLDRYDGIGVDEKTKTIPCRIVVDQPVINGKSGARALVRGMFVKIDIDLPTGPLAKRNQYFTSVPSKGLLPGNRVRFVKDEKLVSRKVEVVDRVQHEGEEHVVIRLSGEGIQLGDWAVVSPVGTVSATTKIRIDGQKSPTQKTAASNQPKETKTKLKTNNQVSNHKDSQTTQ